MKMFVKKNLLYFIFLSGTLHIITPFSLLNAAKKDEGKKTEKKVETDKVKAKTNDDSSKEKKDSKSKPKPVPVKTKLLPKITQKEKEEENKVKDDKAEDGPSLLNNIDNISINEPGGNWLKKRIWWQEAEKKIGKIEKSIENIINASQDFYKKQTKINTELFDPFYIDIGFKQGQLDEILNVLISYMQKKRKKEITLNKVEKDILKKLESNKDTLESLKKEVDSVKKIDAAVNDALEKLSDQTNKIFSYKEQAQEKFKAIAKVLDPEKAKELYYEMDVSWQNIKNLEKYIAQEVKKHFFDLSSKAKEQVTTIKGKLQKLKQDGVSLKDEISKIEEEEKKKKKKEEEKKALQKKQEEEKLAKEKEQEKLAKETFSQKVVNTASYYASVVSNYVSLASNYVLKSWDFLTKKISEKISTLKKYFLNTQKDKSVVKQDNKDKSLDNILKKKQKEVKEKVKKIEKKSKNSTSKTLNNITVNKKKNAAEADNANSANKILEDLMKQKEKRGVEEKKTEKNITKKLNKKSMSNPNKILEDLMKQKEKRKSDKK